MFSGNKGIDWQKVTGDGLQKSGISNVMNINSSVMRSASIWNMFPLGLSSMAMGVRNTVVITVRWFMLPRCPLN
ncbi:hypothetical protein SSYM_1389 [Serratia symbiotica str. Tucson]|uniref:Uncharacterized protein n=1 Tax=Serratia symbiotica str. Tucson TaxID=914128 RepID=E9CM70_9GAMM|nr:hypothetical protein SSYM_1389 [Serratia symbiotica str. Tucson]